MKRLSGLAAVWLLLGVVALLPQENQTNLDGFLVQNGITSRSLGVKPDGTWSRFPDPARIPYVSAVFMPLFREPFKIYDLAANAAVISESYASMDFFNKMHTSVYRLFYYLGVDRLVTGFRVYGFPVPDLSAVKDPLLEGVRRIYEVKKRNFTFYSMDKIADYPRLDAELQAAAKVLHPDVRKIVAEMLFQIADAYSWWLQAMRHVDMREAVRVFELRDLVDTQFDGMEYFPEIDDIMAQMDWHSFYRSSLQLSFASERLVFQLKELRQRQDIRWSEQCADIETPMGKILIRGSRDDTLEVSHALLVIDLGGNDTYTGNPGGNSDLEHPFGILLDLSGNDTYRCTNGLPSLGAAVLGTGILIDVEGDDHYAAESLSQGAGLLGAGIMADFAGNDTYQLKFSGQGAGYFGAGLLLDYSGRDSYRIWGNGQGLGGCGGVGVLLDVSGDDTYYAEPDASVTGRPDYHSAGKLSYSYAQGAGVGRRGDVSDGHSWAGGLGMLIDLAGNDHYTSANWSIGSGYWFGMGILYDRKGDDIYKASVFSLASGAHFAIGALLDEEGNDSYEAYGDSTSSMAFGHDYTVALLLDKKGNDTYSTRNSGFGMAINMSQAFFFDLAGDDVYRSASRNDGFGQIQEIQPPFPIYNMYWAYSSQLGLFVDAGGNDRYLVVENGKEVPSDRFRNGGSFRFKEHRWEFGMNLGLFFDGKLETASWFRNRFAVSTN